MHTNKLTGLGGAAGGGGSGGGQKVVPLLDVPLPDLILRINMTTAIPGKARMNRAIMSISF